MLLEKKIPLVIYNTSNTPDRLEGEDRKTVRAGAVLTYQIMVVNQISFQEMHDMGCNMKQVMLFWAEEPSAKNITFSGMEKDGLEILIRILRDESMKERFQGITWFSIGLTLRDMMKLRPRFEVMKTMKVTCNDLIANCAQDHGLAWQNYFDWSGEEWKEIGFVRKQYEKRIMDMSNISDETKQRYLQWGPRGNS